MKNGIRSIYACSPAEAFAHTLINHNRSLAFEVSLRGLACFSLVFAGKQQAEAEVSLLVEIRRGREQL